METTNKLNKGETMKNEITITMNVLEKNNLYVTDEQWNKVKDLIDLEKGNILEMVDNLITDCDELMDDIGREERCI